MLTLLAALPALAQAPSQASYRAPNSLIGVGVGTPWLVSVRGEAWVADEASFELGVGTLGAVDQQIGLDWAVRWRPDLLCFGCDGQVLGTFGVGVGGTVGSDVALDGGAAFDDPWGFAVGPDVVGTFTYWFSSNTGVQVSGRAGIGAAWIGDDFSAIGAEPWAFLSAGLAF